MKKLTSTLAFASLIFLASCNKDKTSTAPAPKTGIDLLTDGSWDFESMRNVVKLNGYVLGDTTELMIGKATFLKNNTVISVIPGEGSDTTSYIYHGDSLTIEDVTFDIISLTTKKLVLEDEEIETDSTGIGSFSFTTTISLKK